MIENNENLMIDEEKILKVSEVNRIVKNLLQTKIPKLWISGEISNFVEASSGHWYFTLKDSNAQIRCTMFKGQNSSVTIKPKAGDSIEAFGNVSLYEPRGDYQINIEKIREAGAGNLFEKFLELKMKLEKQGLFDESRKKILPEYPTRVGVITSPSGAALHDVISTLYKNNSPIQTFIYPTAVQGLEAAKKIIKAIEIANERMDVQVLILCRGGGSIEDLWSFNDESLIYAIAHSKIPIISGVGHETDFTLTDFVSDFRAPTPTSAATSIIEKTTKVEEYIAYYKEKLNKSISFSLKNSFQKIDYLEKRLVSPTKKLEILQKQLKTFSINLESKITQLFSSHTKQLTFYKKIITPPTSKLRDISSQLCKHKKTLSLKINKKIAADQQKINFCGEKLEILNPNNIMAKGYSIVYNNDKIISNSDEANLNETLLLRLHEGSISAIVKAKK